MSPCVWSVCGLMLLVWMSMVQLVCGYGQPGETKSVFQKEAKFNVTYKDTVTRDNQTIYAFKYTVSTNKTVAIRVAVEVLSQRPIQFVLRQKHSVLSFQVPLIIRDPNERTFMYSSMERTLCPPHTLQVSGEHSLFVEVWTLGSDSSQYQLRASPVDSFILETDKKLNFTASPSQPKFFKYVYPEGVDRVTVKVTSETNFPCSVLSIQDIQCPVYDLDSNVDFLGIYQTITTLGAITVQRTDFHNNSFYVVVVVNPEDEACGGLSNSSRRDTFRDAGERTKSLEVVVFPSIKFKPTFKDVFPLVMGCVLLTVIIFLDILVVTFPTSKQRRETAHEEASRSPEAQLQPLDMEPLRESDLVDRAVLKDDDYFWNIVTISVFYALPVIQLVFIYQTITNKTGDQDICYYNFLCAHPLGGMSSFNNILSNVGYVLLGLVFHITALIRAIKHKRAQARNDTNTLEFGIHKSFDLFYAMGTALMMEGVLSATYHICPNAKNFQFDTSFMYIIAVLCMFKLYQNRHPNISTRAHSAYGCLALVIYLSVHGVVVHDRLWFGIIFSVIHILPFLLTTLLFWPWKDWIRLCKGRMRIDPLGSSFVVLGYLINICIAIYGLVKKTSDFSSYVLAIAICILLMYLAYYIILKLRNKERITWLAVVCIVFTAIVWVFALFFFFQKRSMWEKTAAESREHNSDCILLSFFDSHDIWHFLSSIAMFGSFLVLLIIDDDLDNVQRNDISIF